MRAKLWRWLVPPFLRRRRQAKPLQSDHVNCRCRLPHERDAAALRSDWDAVGRDLWSAIEEYDQMIDEQGDDAPAP